MKTHVNLLPWTCRRNQLVRARLVQWSVLWIAVAGLMLTVFGFRAAHYRAAAALVKQLEDRDAPLDKLRTANAGLRTRLETLRGQEAILVRLETPHPALTLLGLVSRSARECGGAVQVEQLSMTAAGTADASRATAGAAHGTSVTIKGIALDNLSASRFVVALRNSMAFDKVELKSSGEAVGAERKACSYLVECGY